MIDAVLWDFGGVFTPSPFAACRTLATTLGIAPELLVATLFGPYDDDTDHPWHLVERGEGTVAAALAHAVAEAKRHGFELDLQAVFGAMRDDGIDRTIMVEKVRELRGRGLRMGIITNNAKEFADAWRNMIPIDELFDDVVDSSAVGMRKPNPAIYRLALERLGGIAAERAVFLDDFEPNVVAAQRVGMHGVVVEHPTDALADLDRILAG
jgi:epoxide hydrolase-like predicted phosphatase